jgi:hypothetical protein
MHLSARLVAVVSLVAVVCFSFEATAQNCGQLGEWNGPLHDVPQAGCHPHCTGPNGNAYDYSDSFPSNVVLDATKSSIVCSNIGSDNGCAFLEDAKVSVDNVAHVVYTHVKSRSVAVRVKPVVCILKVN